MPIHSFIHEKCNVDAWRHDDNNYLEGLFALPIRHRLRKFWAKSRKRMYRLLFIVGFTHWRQLHRLSLSFQNKFDTGMDQGKCNEIVGLTLKLAIDLWMLFPFVPSFMQFISFDNCRRSVPHCFLTKSIAFVCSSNRLRRTKIIVIMSMNYEQIKTGRPEIKHLYPRR